jgi:chromosome partitioning protein
MFTGDVFMKAIALFNQKGGVGKTTCTINIGAGLARLGKKVLVIDFDPQASLTYSLGIDAHELAHTVYEVLKQEILPEEALLIKHGMTVLPASISLSAFETEFAAKPGKELILKNILKNMTGFDYVFVDCPPGLGLLTINVLAAVHEVFIPVQTEFLALQGLSQFLDTFKLITKKINPILKLGGIIGTRYNRRKINKEVIGQLHDSFKEKVFKTVIRENVALTEAPSFGQDIYTYNAESLGAEDYLLLCKEIIKAREGVV